jgi:hypothetical protein
VEEKLPTTLDEALVYFSNPDHCRSYIVSKRWPDGLSCPVCGNSTISFLVNGRWECGSHHPRRYFSAKTGTILENSRLPLEKWLICVWLLSNCKSGASSQEMHRILGVTQKTAWLMLHRLRLAIEVFHRNTPEGKVENPSTPEED